MHRKKVNDGSNAVLLPIKLLTGYCVTLCFINLVLPVTQGKLGVTNFPWTFLFCCFYISSIFTIRGEKTEYNIPIAQLTVCRLGQYLMSQIKIFNSLNNIIFSILCILDIILIVSMCLHKKFYEFEVIKNGNNSRKF